MFLRCFFCAAFVAVTTGAHAGAFLQPEGKMLVIQQAVSSKLRSDCSCPPVLKREVETVAEWGLLPFLTLLQKVSNAKRIIAPEMDELSPPMVTQLGLRAALWQQGSSLVSMQFAMRAQNDPLRQGLGLPLREIHLMAGYSFNTVLGPGFLSLAPGLRGGAGAALEGDLELAAGIMLSERWQALGGLYSLWRRPEGLDRGGHQHKLQVGVLFNPGRQWSLQVSTFATPLVLGLGRETGWTLAVWKRL